MNLIKKLYKKLFISGYWTIAMADLSKSNEFVSMYDNKKNWAADPFIVEHNGKIFIFVELYDYKNKRGKIAVAEFKNLSEKLQFEVIISDKYHFSYPNIFKFNNEYYMIPESGENLSVDLYHAVDFPYKWEKVKTLLFGEDYADSTFFDFENKKYLINYQKKEGKFSLNLYEFCLNKFELIQVDSIITKNDNIRPAGNFFYKNNKIYRPSQKNDLCYGEAIIINEVNGLFDEKIVTTVFPSQIKVLNKKINRVHTLNFLNEMCVIDAFCEKFDLFKIFNMGTRIFRRIIKQGRKKHEK